MQNYGTVKNKSGPFFPAVQLTVPLAGPVEGLQPQVTSKINIALDSASQACAPCLAHQ